jgi:hypothetical protein
MGVSGQYHAPAALYPRGKDPRYPLDKRLSGPQSRSGRSDWNKNPLPLSGIEPRSSIFEVLSRHYSWESEENQEKPCQDSRSASRDLNPPPPEQEAGMLTTLCQRSVTNRKVL